MGNLFKALSEREGNVQLPSATAPTDNTRVMYNVGKYFNKVNGIKRPSPQSVNKAPGTFNYQSFADSIAQQESNNNYLAQGKIIKDKNSSHFGDRAYGKYQFMPSTLKGLGFNVSSEQFLNNKNLQEKAMQALTMQNARSLGIQDINKMNEQQFKALSMAHYSGVGKARKFLQNGISSDLLKSQMSTGSAFPSISNYADSTLQYAKQSHLNKAQYIFNKLIDGE